MILYNPVDGDVFTSHFIFRPRTCFVMTKLGASISPEIIEIRSRLEQSLIRHSILEIDASSVVTGRDFLNKIWSIIIAVPLGIAIINRNLPKKTLANIFYEIGLLQAYGKETLVIKTSNSSIPSDFVRTEYLEYNSKFDDNIEKYFTTFFSYSDYYEEMADQLENDPLLAIDYLRRAYLITGEDKYRKKAKRIFTSSPMPQRARNSVEMLLIHFALNT